MPVQHQDELLPLLLQLLDLGFQLCVHEFQPLRFLYKNREMWLFKQWGEALPLGRYKAGTCLFPVSQVTTAGSTEPAPDSPHPRVTDFLQVVSLTPVTLACVTSGINPSRTLGPAQIMCHLSPLAHSSPAVAQMCPTLSCFRALHKKQRVGEEWRPSGSRAGAWRVHRGVRGGPCVAGQWKAL